MKFKLIINLCIFEAIEGFDIRLSTVGLSTGFSCPSIGSDFKSNASERSEEPNLIIASLKFKLLIKFYIFEAIEGFYIRLSTVGFSTGFSGQSKGSDRKSNASEGSKEPN